MAAALAQETVNKLLNFDQNHKLDIGLLVSKGTERLGKHDKNIQPNIYILGQCCQCHVCIVRARPEDGSGGTLKPQGASRGLD